MKKSNLFWQIFYSGTAAGMLANAVLMLLWPRAWFYELPAKVPDFGPYNEHFIRDIGCVYAVLGGAAVVAIFHQRLRQSVAILLAMFYGTHSILHVYDTLRGYVGPEHWLIDLPLVHIPALIFCAVAVALRTAAVQSHA